MVVRRENYVTVQGWMVTDLNLKGNSLLIYAIIYGFSQDDGQWFTGSRQYLADWTNSTKRGVQQTLNGLVETGLIEKSESMVNGVRFCSYRVNKVPQGGEQSSLGVVNKVPWGGEQSSPNNIDISISNNYRDIDRERKADKPPKSVRHKYGQYSNVLLTDEDMAKLKAEFPNDWAARIERLSEYMASSGKAYKNHLATIRNWAKRDAEKAAPKKAARPDYGNPEDFYG